ncbi:WD repeat-containing protein 24 [Nowakowskiella sp. JEL0078]|nr:WD repeat-containing protein 24 [Nowakowskiella sp. JEL0078]
MSNRTLHRNKSFSSPGNPKILPNQPPIQPQNPMDQNFLFSTIHLSSHRANTSNTNTLSQASPISNAIQTDSSSSVNNSLNFTLPMPLDPFLLNNKTFPSTPNFALLQQQFAPTDLDHSTGSTFMVSSGGAVSYLNGGSKPVIPVSSQPLLFQNGAMVHVQLPQSSGTLLSAGPTSANQTGSVLTSPVSGLSRTLSKGHLFHEAAGSPIGMFPDLSNFVPKGSRYNLNINTSISGKPDSLLDENSISMSNQSSDALKNVLPVRYKAGGSLSAMCASPEGDRVVVAGPNILQILRISSSRTQEVMNLMSSNHRGISFTDVKWGNKFTPHIIATATNEGGIYIWDINRNTQEKMNRIIYEHKQIVHRISFHPLAYMLLVSASQDHSMKLWDLRDKKVARHSLTGKGESVRDIMFSPTNPYEFVSAFDNGSIQTWDIRNTAGYVTKWSAHNSLVISVDWHPNGRYLVSGGRDKIIKVWDMSTDNSKASFTFQTIEPISQLRWRPINGASSESHQIASCSLARDNRIQIWDLSRPFVPAYTIQEHNAVANGLHWHSSNKLWSCSADRTFVSTTINDAYRPLHQNSRAISSWNNYGDLAFTIDLEDHESRAITPIAVRRPAPLKRIGYEIPFNFWGLTVKDGEIVYGKEKVTNGSPPPDDIFEVIFEAQQQARLNERDLSVDVFSPNHETGIMDTKTFDHEAFIFLAENYLLDNKRISESCDHNAEMATLVSQYKIAQTWRIVKLLATYVESPPKNITLMENNPKTEDLHLKENVILVESDNQDNNELQVHSNSENTCKDAEKLLSPVTDCTDGSSRLQSPESNITNEYPSASPSGDENSMAISFQVQKESPIKSNDSDFSNYSDNEVQPKSAISENGNNPAAWEIVSSTSVESISEIVDKLLNTSLTETTQNPDEDVNIDGDIDENDDEKTSNTMTSSHAKQIFSHKFLFTSSDEDDDDDDDELTDDNNDVVRIKMESPKVQRFRSQIRRRKHVSASYDEPRSRKMRRKLPHRLSLQTSNRKALLRGVLNGSISDSKEVVAALEESGVPSEAPTTLKEFWIAAWNAWGSVYDVLDFYLDEGNVQMCVSLLYIFRDRLPFPVDREEQLVWAYVDMLHRFQLWTPAVEVMRESNSESVRTKNQQLSIHLVITAGKNMETNIQLGGVLEHYNQVPNVHIVVKR